MLPRLAMPAQTLADLRPTKSKSGRMGSSPDLQVKAVSSQIQLKRRKPLRTLQQSLQGGTTLLRAALLGLPVAGDSRPSAPQRHSSAIDAVHSSLRQFMVSTACGGRTFL